MNILPFLRVSFLVLLTAVVVLSFRRPEFLVPGGATLCCGWICARIVEEGLSALVDLFTPRDDD